MKKTSLLSAALLVTLCLATTGIANAANVNLYALQHVSSVTPDVFFNGNFPTAGDAYCSATNGCGTIPAGGATAPMWTAGDWVVSADFLNTGITSATDLSVNTLVTDFLGQEDEIVWYLVNGTPVAQADIPGCNFCQITGTISGTVNFADIPPDANGGYQIEILLTNTIAGGDGSIWFNDGGTFQLSGTATPEPGSMVLLGSGVLGLAGILRRKLTL